MELELGKRYIVTPDGQVINRKRNKPVKFGKDSKGYMRARLYCPEISNHIDGRRPIKLHRLVAMFHLETYSEDLQVNHKNGIKDDNRVENLEWCTHSENAIHKFSVLWKKWWATWRTWKLSHKSKPVIVYDLNYNKIQEYDSAIIACDELWFKRVTAWRYIRWKNNHIFRWYIIKYKAESLYNNK